MDSEKALRGIKDEIETAETHLLPLFAENSGPPTLSSSTDTVSSADDLHDDTTISRLSSVAHQESTTQFDQSSLPAARESLVSILTSGIYSATTHDSAAEEAPRNLFQKAFGSSLEWSWEVGASLVSIISIVLICIFLKKVNGMALANWNGPVQTNTIISILTTIVRSCLMIPIASCLGQYKWRHFKQPAKLESLQIFDKASRGPWGGMLLLLNSKVWQATTALCLSFVTILALGIEPSAQQILSFPTHEARLSNVTAYVGAADGWEVSGYKKGFGNKTALSTYILDLLHIDSYMTSRIFDPPEATNFYCPDPATRCFWDNFTTLALCENNPSPPDIKITCPNDTSNADNSAIPRAFFEDTCNYTVQSTPSNSYVKTCPTSPPPSIIFRLEEIPLLQTATWTVCDSLGSLEMNLLAIRLIPDSNGFTNDIDHLVTTFSGWTWCEKILYNVTVTPRGSKAGSITQEKLLMLEYDTNTTLSWYMSRATGRKYHIFAWDQELDSFATSNLRLLYPLVGTTNFTKNMANIVSNLMTQNNTQVNTHHQMVPGDAYFDEVYIRVRWYWLILPLMETILTSILLGISIILSRKEPLLKNSVLAYLSHGLEGWENGELDIRHPESVAKLEEVLGSQTAKLSRGEHGLLKLRKADAE